MLVSVLPIEVPNSGPVPHPASTANDAKPGTFHKTLQSSSHAKVAAVALENKANPPSEGRGKVRRKTTHKPGGTEKSLRRSADPVLVSSLPLEQLPGVGKTIAPSVSLSEKLSSSRVQVSNQGERTSNEKTGASSQYVSSSAKPALTRSFTLVKTTVKGATQETSVSASQKSGRVPLSKNPSQISSDKLPTVEASDRAKTALGRDSKAGSTVVNDTLALTSREAHKSGSKLSSGRESGESPTSGSNASSGTTVPSTAMSPEHAVHGVSTVKASPSTSHTTSTPTSSKPPGWTIQSTGSSSESGVKQSTWTIRPPLSMGPAMKMELTQNGSHLKANLTVSTENLGLLNATPTTLPHQAVHLPEGVSTLQFSLSAQGGSSHMGGQAFAESGGGQRGNGGSEYGRSGSLLTMGEGTSTTEPLQGVDYRA